MLNEENTVAPTEEVVDVKDTVSVEELEGTKRAVEADLQEQLLNEAPGGFHAKMDERAQMRNMILTRNRQINAWMQGNFTANDNLMVKVAGQLRDVFTGLISTLSAEDYRKHPLAVLFDGDAIELEWNKTGLVFSNIKLRFNQTTGYPVIQKTTPIYAGAIALKHQTVFKLLSEAGVDIMSAPQRDEKNTCLKSMIFSIGQCVEIFNAKPATILKFKTAPSQEVSLKPLDIVHTMSPTGFNALLKYMSERKLIAMSRRDLSEWTRDKSKDVQTPLTSLNPALNAEV